MANKFKVGDKVIGNDKAEIYLITNKGWIGKVLNVLDDETIKVKDEAIPCGFTVSTSCFDLLERKNEQKIVITTDGKRTTAVLYDGKKRVDEASAVCSDDDTFDFMTGAKIACERLTEEKEPERDLRELLKTGTFGKDDRWGLFVVVGENLVFETGGYERIENYNSNLEANCSNIDEIYGDSPFFRHAKSGGAEVIWKRKEIK